jgi:hypothetical protein
MEYSGAGGKLIHEKTRSKKSRDTVPLTLFGNFKGQGPLNFDIKTSTIED